MRSAG